MEEHRSAHRNVEGMYINPSVPPLDSELASNGHILTLDERRRKALEEVDNADFSLFHVKVILVAGSGFFTDAYNIFSINIAATMMGYVYGHDNQQLSRSQELGVKVATPAGTLVGQLIFGWLADVVGRKRMYGIELIIIIVGTFVQALAGSGHGVNFIAAIITWRFLTGIGIGGDYPLSAIISSEFSATRFRGRAMTAVFTAQGWGTFTAAFVGFIIVRAFKHSVLNDDPAVLSHVDSMWRLLIGLGCVPAAAALYFRLTIPESPRFTMDIERNVQQAATDVDNFLRFGTFVVDPDAVIQRVQVPKASIADFTRHFGEWENMKVLIGTMWSWFALDIAFFGLGLDSGILPTNFSEPSTNGTEQVYSNLNSLCVVTTIVAAGGLIPGSYACLFLIDRWGRKPIQYIGFTMLTLILVIMGTAYDKLAETDAPKADKRVFIFLYCLSNFFQNFGPNTTTFIIPGEVFPTRYRSTAYGISAATGKLGAIIAQVSFAFLKDTGGPHDSNHFVGHMLEIFAFFMFTGIFSTILLPETNGRTLEDLSNETQVGFVDGFARPLENRYSTPIRSNHRH